MLITSRANPRIKWLRTLGARKHREQEGVCFVDGVRLVSEAVAAGAEITLMVLAPDAMSDAARQAAAPLKAAGGPPVLLVGPHVFDALAPRGGHEGIAVVVRQRFRSLDDVIPRDELCWLGLGALEHPGSVGTLLRTCDAVGGRGVILLGDSLDPYDPIAVRTSHGAVFSQLLVRATPAELAAWARRHGCFVVGASPDAAAEYQAITYQAPLVLLLGHERTGLPGELRECCDALVRVPMAGRGDSHHVVVAAGLVLYEAFQQARGRPPHPPAGEGA